LQVQTASLRAAQKKLEIELDNEKKICDVLKKSAEGALKDAKLNLGERQSQLSLLEEEIAKLRKQLNQTEEELRKSNEINDKKEKEFNSSNTKYASAFDLFNCWRNVLKQTVFVVSLKNLLN